MCNVRFWRKYFCVSHNLQGATLANNTNHQPSKLQITLTLATQYCFINFHESSIILFIIPSLCYYLLSSKVYLNRFKETVQLIKWWKLSFLFALIVCVILKHVLKSPLEFGWRSDADAMGVEQTGTRSLISRKNIWPGKNKRNS